MSPLHPGGTGYDPRNPHRRKGTQATKGCIGVCSRNGKNRTLSLGEHPERPELTLLNQLVLPPDVVAGQVDVLPAQGRQMRQQL